MEEATATRYGIVRAGIMGLEHFRNLRALPVGVAAHRSIDEGRVVAMSEVLGG
jgi:hypothetical protein